MHNIIDYNQLYYALIPYYTLNIKVNYNLTKYLFYSVIFKLPADNLPLCLFSSYDIF